MRIADLKGYLTEEGLISVHFDGCVKSYISGDAVFQNGSWVTNEPDVFGIYSDEGVFCFFITDSERGVVIYSDVYEKEEDACEALLTKIKRNEKIYGNGRKIAVKSHAQYVDNDYTYYKFDYGDGGMRKKGSLVEYLDENGEWIENFDLLRKFLNGDCDFEKISEAEAEKLVRNRKKRACMKGFI